MVNSETTLQEFIQYIPLLNKDCHLQSVVSAIYSSSQRMVALVNDDGTPQGIIYSYLLLNSIKEKVSKEQKEYFEITEVSLTQASIPLVSLSNKTKVRDFFDHFLLELKEKKQDYWIVNQEQKLLGILNIPKLLQVLCFEQAWRKNESQNVLAQPNFSRTDKVLPKKVIEPSYFCEQNSARKHLASKNEKANSNGKKNNSIENKREIELKNLNSSFYSVLNNLSFPLIIENKIGEIYYENSLWRDEIKAKSKSNYIKTKPYDTEWQLEVAQKALNHKITKSNLKRIGNQNISYRIKDNKKYAHCPTVNTHNNISNNSNLQQQIKIINSNLLKYLEEEKSSIDKKSLYKIYKNSSWHFYRVPLFISKDRIEISDSPNYWLRFATKLSCYQNGIFDDILAVNKTKLQQLKNELIINVSHDIKSPLTAIIGLSSLLKKEKVGTLDRNQIRFSQIIHQSGKKLISLIDNFLNITHLTTENFELNLESIEIESFCKQTYLHLIKKLEAIETDSNSSKLFPSLQFDVDSDTIAIADRNCLTQIMALLLENALELTSVDRISIKAEYWSRWLAITVYTEKGLTEAQQNFLVTNLSEPTNFLTSQDKSQKLRFMLAQHLAQIHGGDISLISQNNYGSQFTLLLPKSDRPSEDTIFETDKDSKNSLVLIVETSSNKIIDLNDRLKDLGYHCAIALNQADALYKACRLKPHKIIVNSSFIKPTEDLIATFKTNPFTQNIPLVVINDVSLTEKAPNSDCAFSTNHLYSNIYNSAVEEFISFPCEQNVLTKLFPSLVPSSYSALKPKFTVLRLSLTETKTPAIKNSPLDFVFESSSFNLSHQIIEADDIEQADLLARIWNIDAVIWDDITLIDSEKHLQFFAKSDVLAVIPLITLNTRTAEIANKIDNLTVFPCLLPANERSSQKLAQVIQIAAGYI